LQTPTGSVAIIEHSLLSRLGNRGRGEEFKHRTVDEMPEPLVTNHRRNPHEHDLQAQVVILTTLLTLKYFCRRTSLWPYNGTPTVQCATVDIFS